MPLKTIHSANIGVNPEDLDFNYSPALTPQLDALEGAFTQDTINALVLWKVNRYCDISQDLLQLINGIDPKATQLNAAQTQKILLALLGTKGVRLPMASTFLRFKNPAIYQIIDQRVYRFIYGQPLKLATTKTDKHHQAAIELYLKYLEDLRQLCPKLNIPFEKADRILYQMDKRLNKEVPIKY